MSSRIVITFLVCLISSSIFASNNWADFDAHDIYPVYDTSNCEFPFTYNNRTYHNCTTDGDNGDRPWCSLTPDYVGLFTYCYNFWKTTLKCDLPFNIGNVEYTKPDYLTRRTPRYKQCKTKHPDYRYRYAIEEHLNKRSNTTLLHTCICDPAYRSISKHHTKCAGPSDFAIPVDFSHEDKKTILDVHNDYRASVRAPVMFKLYWDEELADMAQTHSNMCAYDHDLAKNRLTLSYKWKNGQTMVMSYGIVNELSFLLTTMLDSHQSQFKYGVGCATPGMCTQYTQIMLSNMTRVGCGETHCLFPDRIERYLTCNYIHAQYTDNYMIPYALGSLAGAGCPDKKDDRGLCDCGKKICDYDRGEHLEPNTCKCVGGAGKRSVDEDDVSEVELAGGKSALFAALPSATNMDSESAEKVNVIHHE